MLTNHVLIYNSNARLESILCAYQNRTNSTQIIKIENVVNFYWEKVVLPWQTILFNTVKQAELKVYSNNSFTTIVSDTIPCSKLQIDNSSSTQLSESS